MSTFSPSPAELAIVQAIFNQHDPQKNGIITGDVAVRAFAGAHLPAAILGEIWNIADSDNNGFLPRKGVAVAVRLIGWAQKGEPVSEALINKPGPLPTIEGIQVPLTQQNTGLSIPKSPPPGGLPPLTPQDKAKFQRLFNNCGPSNGLLSGDKARDVFVKSKLSVDKLSAIWNLADTQDRGALDATDFAIGMYLIQACMSGTLSFVPSTLPPGLYEQASSGGAPNPISPHNTGSFARTAPVQQQYTGQPLQPQTTGQALRSGPPLPSRPSVGAGAFGFQPSIAAPQWDVSAEEKKSADALFDGLDPARRGYIEGDVAVPFMLQSNLPEDTLAHVWDLSDINNDGRLTRDGFAVAMHLIKGKLAGRPIPSQLPPSLIPPSMRGAAPAPAPAAPPPASEPLRDLLWDDTPPPSTTAASPPQQPSGPFAPQSTGGPFGAQATGGGLGQQSTGSALTSPPQNQTRSPFASSTPAAAQDPFGSSFSAPSSAHKDLLGDDDDGLSASQLHDQSAEIGNVQNQLNSTNRSLDTAKSERATLEQTLANQASQLSALQTQLSSAKAAYETETSLLTTLRKRHSTQTSDIAKAREELIRAESDLSAVRVEKAEIEGAFLRDKEEVRTLQRQMVETGTEAEGLKAQIEKAKKEAKQQKGLLAIARKQLATKEAERAKAEKELAEANGEVEAAAAETKEAEALLAKEDLPAPVAPVQSPERVKSPASESVLMAAAQPLPVTPEVTSPAASMKSNNPFERLVASPGAGSPRSQSPFAPFANADTSGSATAPAAAQAAPAPEPTSHDPFGFDTAFEEPSVTPAPTAAATEPTDAATEAGGSTPRPPPPPGISVDNVHGAGGFSPTSARTSDNDLFHTPPTSADPRAQSPKPDISSPVQSAAAQFPAIDAQLPAGNRQSVAATDLGAQLKELEVEESDSDSDNEPLANRSVALAEAKAAEAPAVETNGAPAGTSFDDAFGEVAPTPKPASPPGITSPLPDSAKPASSDPFGAPSTNGFPAPEAQKSDAAPSNGSAAPAGVDAFDEAMGRIPSNGATPAKPEFSFDSAFDDNFDFASATADGGFQPAAAPQSASSAFPPAPTAASSAFPPAPGVANGKSPLSLSPTKTNGFDSVFGLSDEAPAASKEPGKPTSFDEAFSPSTSAGDAAQKPASKSATEEGGHGISFDDAFGGLDSSNALKLDDKFGSTSTRGTPLTDSGPTPFPAGSPPTSPREGPTSPMASVRSRSPPPRAVSPTASRPRPSTGSSHKEDKLKEPPARHSKLSIRLPFGKKKSKQNAHAAESLPAPPQPSHSSHLLAPVEERQGATTPAVDDDVDAVKQLCGMGFSRSQAVDALEKYGYDVQRALNSLLGSQ